MKEIMNGQQNHKKRPLIPSVKAMSIIQYPAILFVSVVSAISTLLPEVPPICPIIDEHDMIP